jgi:DNA-binding beta-propeller fold protein YncE
MRSPFVWFAVAAVCLASASAGIDAGAQLDSAVTYRVDLAPQPVAVGAVSSAGVLYIADLTGGAVHAFSRTAQRLWTHTFPQGRTPFGLAVDASGEVLVVESHERVAWRLDGTSGAVVGQIPLVTAFVSPRFSWLSGPAPGPGGSVCVVGRNTNADGSVHCVDDTGKVRLSFGPTPKEGYTRDRGWVGAGAEGHFYYRPPGTLVFERYDSSGRFVSTVDPAVIPFRPLTETNNPGDTVFATHVLPDGRVVVQVTHRSPYEGDKERVLRTVVDIRVYVIRPNGSLERSLKASRHGNLLAASSESLYFLKTQQLLRPGEPTTVTVVPLD